MNQNSERKGDRQHERATGIGPRIDGPSPSGVPTPEDAGPVIRVQPEAGTLSLDRAISAILALMREELVMDIVFISRLAGEDVVIAHAPLDTDEAGLRELTHHRDHSFCQRVLDGRLPAVPTLAELGSPALSTTIWFGVLAPAATPRPVLDAILASAVAAHADPALRARLEAQNFDVPNEAGPAFERAVAAETQRWARLVKASGFSASD